MSEQHTYEVTVKELEDIVELGKQLDKLERTGSFKKIILKEYFEHHAQAMAPISVSPDERQRQAGIIGLQGVGSLQTFLNSIRRKAMVAEQELAEYYKALEEVGSEDLTEE